MPITLKPEPLSRERFARYGDVIDTAGRRANPMNTARFERFDDLCAVDVDADGNVSVSIARCRTATSLPYRIDCVERHPLSSQAFIPLGGQSFVVVVGPPGESIDAQDLRAFRTNGRQGVNYFRGAWHMPLIAFEPGQEFLIIDRAGEAPNCEECVLDDVVTLVSDAK